jgi:hypothetical protein
MKRSLSRMKPTWSNKIKFDAKMIISLGAILGVAITALSYKLASLVPFSEREVPEFNYTASLSQIQDNIMFLPIKIVELTILKVHGIDAHVRLSSVFFALLAGAMVFIILKKWYTNRLAVLITIMFITSSWFLHAGRLAVPDVMYLLVVPALILVYTWVLSKEHRYTIYLAPLLLGFTFYIPGGLLIALGFLALFYPYIIKALKRFNTSQSVSFGILLLLSIIPLVYGFVQNPSQAILWLGFDTSQDLSILLPVHNLVDVVDALLWHGLHNEGLWVVGTPILDIFTLAMAILGGYAYRNGYFASREKFVLGSLAIIALLLLANGTTMLGLLIPVVYLLVANGVAYLLQSWFTVFPRNPFARSFGIVAITAVVFISIAYNVQRYFVAWPQQDGTISALQERP